MSNTARLRAGGAYAVEGVFGDGRAPAVCGEAARRRINDGRVPGIRDLAEDRVQDLQPVQGEPIRGAERPLAATGPLRQPAGAPAREPYRPLQARDAALGRAQDSRAPGSSTGWRPANPGKEHDPRGP